MKMTKSNDQFMPANIEQYPANLGKRGIWTWGGGLNAMFWVTKGRKMPIFMIFFNSKGE